MTPADLHEAARLIREDDASAHAVIAGPDFPDLIADWLDRCAHSWATLIKAADEVIDTADPKQVEAGELLRKGPYDADIARSAARAILGGWP